jgi:putative drug exporter of the RND superfamily
MFGRLGRFVVQHPWWTIGAWLVTAIVLVAFAPTLHNKTDQTDFLPSKYEVVQASKIAQQAFPSKDQKTTPAMVVVKRTDGQQLTPADQVKISQLALAIQAKHIPQVTTALTGPMTLSQNHRIQLIAVPLPQGFGDQKIMNKDEDAVKAIRTLSTAQLKGGDLTYGVAGDIATTLDNAESQALTLLLVTAGAAALIFLIIVIIFRSVIAAVLPLIVVVLVSVVQSAVTAYAAKAFNLTIDDGFAPIIDIVLFGIGADYILFLLFRYRERLRLGEDAKTAMVETVERVGEAIASAAGAVIVAFLVLMLASLKSFGALGPQLAIAVGVLFITSMTLVPAVMSLLGRYTYWPSKAWQHEPAPGLWARLGGFVARKPVAAVAASGLLLVILATASLGFKADYDFTAGAPQNTESAKAMTDVKNSYPAGTLTPTEVYVKGAAPLDQAALGSYQQTLLHAPGVASAALAGLSPDRSVAKITLVLKDDPNSAKAIALVKGPLRDFAHKNTPPGTKALVGGQTAAFADINTINDRDLSVILPVAVVLIAIILALLLRSLVAPLYLVVAVLGGFAATLGATVLLFQNIEGKPGLVFQLPIFIYLFVMAIGTDYNILMIARLREEAKEGHGSREATRLAVQHAGPTVAAAGILLAGTFGTLVIAPMAMIQEIGFGVAIGILIAAFVMSAFLVPGITALLGHKAWWPGHGDVSRKAPDPAPASVSV